MTKKKKINTIQVTISWTLNLFFFCRTLIKLFKNNNNNIISTIFFQVGSSFIFQNINSVIKTYKKYNSNFDTHNIFISFIFNNNLKDIINHVKITLGIMLIKFVLSCYIRKNEKKHPFNK